MQLGAAKNQSLIGKYATRITKRKKSTNKQILCSQAVMFSFHDQIFSNTNTFVTFHFMLRYFYRFIAVIIILPWLFIMSLLKKLFSDVGTQTLCNCIVSHIPYQHWIFSWRCENILFLGNLWLRSIPLPALFHRIGFAPPLKMYSINGQMWALLDHNVWSSKILRSSAYVRLGWVEVY